MNNYSIVENRRESAAAEVMGYTKFVVQSLILIHGGAAIAAFTFLGDALRSDATVPFGILSLGLFSAGLFIAIIALLAARSAADEKHNYFICQQDIIKSKKEGRDVMGLINEKSEIRDKYLLRYKRSNIWMYISLFFLFSGIASGLISIQLWSSSPTS